MADVDTSPSTTYPKETPFATTGQFSNSQFPSLLNSLQPPDYMADVDASPSTHHPRTLSPASHPSAGRQRIHVSPIRNESVTTPPPENFSEIPGANDGDK
jgi:hypothetical protein